MARVDVTPQTITRDGLVPALTAPTVDGDAIPTGRVFVMAENVGASVESVTVRTPITVDGLDVEELIVSVAVGDTTFIGPFPIRTFGQPSGAVETGGDDQGKAYVDYSTPANFSRAALTIA